jgi:polyisoprenoid-binding protein YceI
MASKSRIALGVFVLFLAGGGLAYWYFMMRDKASPTASLSALSSETTAPAAPEERVDGAWKVQAGPNVFVGYRVGETLLPARTRRMVTGRTPVVEGTLAISGSTVTAAKVTADVTKLASDEGLRDKILESQALETAKYNTAVFTLTQPLTLPAAPAKGTEVKLTAKGTLEVHGVARPFELPLTAKWDGTSITMATVGDGAAFTMADFGFALPKVPISEDDDHGTIEAQLRFVRT